MCGISGTMAKQITDLHKATIEAIIQSQFARGPDYQASIVLQGKHADVILGHNRLSIIDLTDQANQPMSDITGRFCIVYNGEIYNYRELKNELTQLGQRFKTNSDTEVILNAFSQWGINALQRFCGPFAFALYDTYQEELWLCRDRFGIRPLYYTRVNNTLYFASTTNSLAKALSLKPDHTYIAKGLKYLVYEDHSELSPYQGIVSLTAGSYLFAKLQSDGRLTQQINRYYNLSEKVNHLIETLPINNPSELLELVREKLTNAIDIRLRTDVPLAISLSGGLDSSSIASLVSAKHQETVGFSFGHPHHKQSEGPLVAECARYLNIKMEYVWPTPTEMIDALHHTIEVQDAPFSSMSIVAQYLLYKKVQASGIKVLLGGQGGDEVFMGYRKFLFFWMKKLVNEKRYLAMAKNAMQMLPIFFSEIASLKAYWQHRSRYLKSNHSFSSILNIQEAPLVNLNHTKGLLWQRQLQDITQFSLPTLLRYEDRNAMGNSVESRLPYMDHRLVELGLALPETIKLRAGYGKWVIREMMQNKLPDSIRLARFKRGFDIPIKTLLQNGLGRSIRSKLIDSKHIINDYLHSSINIETAFSDHAFLQRRHTMTEAITLLWIAKALT